MVSDCVGPRERGKGQEGPRKVTINTVVSEARHRHIFFANQVHMGSNLHNVLSFCGQLGPGSRDHPTQLHPVGQKAYVLASDCDSPHPPTKSPLCISL